MKKEMAIRALNTAVRRRNPPTGCIFHSDRGSQYWSYDDQKKLPAYSLVPSMSGKVIFLRFHGHSGLARHAFLGLFGSKIPES